MQRLEMTPEYMGVPIFHLKDVVRLLTHARKETFNGERAVRLFQFQTWILYPDKPQYLKWAGLSAAAKLLDRMEENHFVDEDDARRRKEGESAPLVILTDKPAQTIRRISTLGNIDSVYRDIFDHFIAKRGGLLGLLNAPNTAEFDKAISARVDHVNIIADLIDYRLRCIQHGGGGKRLASPQDCANHNHAMFFCWWPTRSIRGERGKTPPNKSVSVRTMRTWWGKMQQSAIFLYLTQKHDFDQLPAAINSDFFADNLLRASKDKAELLRFFGVVPTSQKPF
jgi:hypothetical protein